MAAEPDANIVKPHWRKLLKRTFTVLVAIAALILSCPGGTDAKQKSKNELLVYGLTFVSNYKSVELVILDKDAVIITPATTYKVSEPVGTANYDPARLTDQDGVVFKAGSKQGSFVLQNNRIQVDVPDATTKEHCAEIYVPIRTASNQVTVMINVLKPTDTRLFASVCVGDKPSNQTNTELWENTGGSLRTPLYLNVSSGRTPANSEL